MYLIRARTNAHRYNKKMRHTKWREREEVETSGHFKCSYMDNLYIGGIRRCSRIPYGPPPRGCLLPFFDVRDNHALNWGPSILFVVVVEKMGPPCEMCLLFICIQYFLYADVYYCIIHTMAALYIAYSFNNNAIGKSTSRQRLYNLGKYI